MIDLPYRHHISIDLAVANLDIEALGVAKMSRFSSKHPTFIAHQLYPSHLRRLVEDIIKNFNDEWLLPPVEGEIFDTTKDYLARLQAFVFS